MRKFIFALPLILCCSLSVFAEKINWQIVKVQTLKNSPAVRAAKLTLDNARQKYKQSLTEYLPKVNIGISKTKTFEGSFPKATISNNRDTYSLGVAIDSINLLPLSGVYSNVRTNYIKLKIAELEYKKSVSSAILESTKSYLNLITANENIEMHKKTREEHIRNRNILALKYRAGLVEITLLQTAEAGISEDERELEKAQKAVKTVSAALLTEMGRSDIETILEVDKQQMHFPEKIIKKPDYNSLVATVPEFLIAQYNFENAKVDRNIKYADWLPLLSVSGGYSPEIGSKGGVNFKDTHLTGTMSLSYSIGFGKYYDSKIASNAFQIHSLNFLKTTSDLKIKAEGLYDGLVDAYAELGPAKNNLKVQGARRKIALIQYSNGLLGYNDWRKAETAYKSTEQKLLEAKKAVALKMAEWYNFTCDDFTKDKEE